MKIICKYRSMSTSIGMIKNGDIVDLPDEEIAKIAQMKPLAIEILPELPIEAPIAEPKKAPIKRKASVKKDVKLIN
jgi:hypothetical protein